MVIRNLNTQRNLYSDENRKLENGGKIENVQHLELRSKMYETEHMAVCQRAVWLLCTVIIVSAVAWISLAKLSNKSSYCKYWSLMWKLERNFSFILQIGTMGWFCFSFGKQSVSLFVLQRNYAALGSSVWHCLLPWLVLRDRDCNRPVGPTFLDFKFHT